MRLPMLEPSASPQQASGPRDISSVRVLRISVTDRCNFRCVYCMPQQGVRWLEQQDILSFEEIVEVAAAAIEHHGIRRFKLTGGEPTVRHHLVELVRRLRQLPGIEDLSLTTNGMRLPELAEPLRQAGLDRVTISLDSLRPDRFRRITRTGDLSTVLAGIDRAMDAGFSSVKINCVTMRGVNDDELVDFARLSLDRPLTVRFIEYMPLGHAAVLDGPVAAEESGPAGGCGAQDRGADVLVSEAQARRQIELALGPLTPIPPHAEAGVGPAKVFRLANPKAGGRIGFISAMSAPFCATCNRLRLTATGVLRSCLFEGGEVPLREILRVSSSLGSRRQQIADAMVRCISLKPSEHGTVGREQMSRIGG